MVQTVLGRVQKAHCGFQNETDRTPLCPYSLRHGGQQAGHAVLQ
jgi:hypothetical protein